MQPAVHEPLHGVTLFESNIKLSCMLHLITDTAVGLHPRQLCCRKHKSGNVLYFVAAHKSLSLEFRLGMNKTCQKRQN